MLKGIHIQRSVPRPFVKGFPNFNKGLELDLFFGLFLTLGGASLFLLSTFVLNLIFPGLFLLIIGFLGFIISKRAVRKLQLRKYLYENGEIISGKVIKHGRKFNIFRSLKDYTVTVECNFTKKQTELVSDKFLLWDAMPINSEVLGFKKELDYFFPQEILCKIIID